MGCLIGSAPSAERLAIITVRVLGSGVGLFSRKKPAESGTFRVTGVTRADGFGQVVLNGMPQERIHVSGILQVEGAAPEAFSIDQHFGVDAVPQVGAVVAAEISSRSPLKARVQWSTSADAQKVAALRNDADAQVVQQLMTTGRADHLPGQPDAVGIAFTDPGASATIAAQLSEAMGTPLTVDVDENGVKKRITVGGGGHLSSAESAELQRTGIAATATVTGGARVNVPQAMMPNPEASLWDLELTVLRADGTSYAAQTRVGFTSEARRRLLGVAGVTIPVRVDPVDDSRVAVDSATFDASHPGAPTRI